MFSVALSLTIVEGVALRAERPFLLTLYAAMMGLPLILQSQPRKNDRSDDPADEEA
jgi:hypothetical protein